MELIVVEGADELHSVLPRELSKAVHFVVLPKPFVLLVVGPYVSAFSVKHAVFELAGVA